MGIRSQSPSMPNLMPLSSFAPHLPSPGFLFFSINMNIVSLHIHLSLLRPTTHAPATSATQEAAAIARSGARSALPRISNAGRRLIPPTPGRLVECMR